MKDGICDSVALDRIAVITAYIIVNECAWTDRFSYLRKRRQYCHDSGLDAAVPEKMLNKSTNKTVTIPRWLDILAKREKVNYSHLLQEALKTYLGVQDSAARHFQ